MSLKHLYPMTGSIMLLGLCAMLYGVQSLSLLIFLEGMLLVSLGFRITVNVWEATRLEIELPERSTDNE